MTGEAKLANLGTFGFQGGREMTGTQSNLGLGEIPEGPKSFQNTKTGGGYQD